MISSTARFLGRMVVGVGVQPHRDSGLGAAGDRYVGRPSPYQVTHAQREALTGEDLVGFWELRAAGAKPDPLARMGLAISESALQFRARVLRDAEARPEFWRPVLHLPARLAVFWTTGLWRFETPEEIHSYWSSLGAFARVRLDGAVIRCGLRDGEDLSQVRHKIALDIAREHCSAVEMDIRDQKGEVPGFGCPPPPHGRERRRRIEAVMRGTAAIDRSP